MTTEIVTEPVPLARKDFVSDQEVRWCPGCGDYSILAQTQKLMPDLGIPREKIVFISGIGCSSRLPYYMNTYGFHSIHGRAPTIATGLKASRPDLQVWVITGDGDGLSIGGNHLLHILRRNVDVVIVLFNNRIYGLTKGQYSPTSEMGKRTKSSPMGTIDHPVNPLSVALGAEASFVARSLDIDVHHLLSTLDRAAHHKGTSFVEVYQNCNVFNDGAFEEILGREVRASQLIPLEHGKPIRFGPEQERGVMLDGQGRAKIVDVADVGEEAILIHDERREEPGLAFMLSRLARGPHEPTPIGVFRAVERPTYGEAMQHQLVEAQERSGPGDLTKLLHSGATWEV